MNSIGMIYPDGKKMELIRELITGQDSARQLQTLLQRPLGEDDGSSQLASQFLVKILRSIDRGLCLVGSSNRIEEGNVLNSSVVGHGQVPAFSLDNGGEGSDDSSGTKKRTSALGDRRGCYKRRKSTQTWTVTPTMEDGQAWRKYGQKVILNAKFPRSYFRCTHKYDQNCKATKQVQRMEDNPGMYQTTYIGTHTCNRRPIKPPQFIIPDYPEPETNNFGIVFSDHVKEEVKDQADAKSDLTDNVSFSSLHDNSSNLQTDHLIGFEFSSSRQDENQDDISRMYQLDMDDDGVQSEIELLIRGSVGFQSDLHFDERDFS